MLSQDNVQLSEEQQQLLVEIRQWIQTQVDFHGRSDDLFILKFLLGCKFDMEKIKKKITMYYKNRRNIPQWWANRDVTNDNILRLVHQRLHPTIDEFDNIVKLHSIIIDMAIQRYNCQINGVHWVVDCKNAPMWLIKRLLSPITDANIIYSFLLSMPVRVKSISFLNAPAIANAIWMLCRPFLPQKIKKRIFFYRSDWSSLYDHVPRQLMPDEYGGHAGSMRQHEDAFLREMMNFNDYLIEDNEYG